jgi:flagellar L-ring protein precursor FlgH
MQLLSRGKSNALFSQWLRLPLALLLMLLLLFTQAGCQRLKGVISDEDDMDYQPPVLDYTQPATTSGGLFRVGGHSGSLLQDKRALQVGDILTVVLDESTQSSKSAGTSFDKKTEFKMGVPKLLGSTVDSLETTTNSGREFNGSAKSSQENELRGAIAVTVHQVLPNGTLFIKGEKKLKLNQGDEFIRLSGLVRLEDINSYNRISSQHIANARISYSGRGVLNDSNSTGWLTRFFTNPLFPL